MKGNTGNTIVLNSIHINYISCVIIVVVVIRIIIWVNIYYYKYFLKRNDFQINRIFVEGHSPEWENLSHTISFYCVSDCSGSATKISP